MKYWSSLIEIVSPPGFELTSPVSEPSSSVSSVCRSIPLQPSNMVDVDVQ
ncbi:hypothetical protein ACFSQT_13545 [Mesorhizobium calcicola]|uniref:Uncharacterized protein n=1 Tax=Mesorhizobium calcicola TaxID=1300310 RepID=A0ABW4WEV9_9HYPH